MNSSVSVGLTDSSSGLTELASGLTSVKLFSTICRRYADTDRSSDSACFLKSSYKFMEALNPINLTSLDMCLTSV